MMKKAEYLRLVAERHPQSSHIKTMCLAFLTGGLICMAGEGFTDLYKMLLPEWEAKDIGSLVSITLIFFGALATAVGVYDRLGRFAGAGSVVPITGFANSVAAPAVEFKNEGVIFGVMAKMFTIAGPVIVTGVVASALVSVIYTLIPLWGGVTP